MHAKSTLEDLHKDLLLIRQDSQIGQNKSQIQPVNDAASDITVNDTTLGFFTSTPASRAPTLNAMPVIFNMSDVLSIGWVPRQPGTEGTSLIKLLGRDGRLQVFEANVLGALADNPILAISSIDALREKKTTPQPRNRVPGTIEDEVPNGSISALIESILVDRSAFATGVSSTDYCSREAAIAAVLGLGLLDAYEISIQNVLDIHSGINSHLHNYHDSHVNSIPCVACPTGHGMFVCYVHEACEKTRTVLVQENVEA